MQASARLSRDAAQRATVAEKDIPQKKILEGSISGWVSRKERASE